MYLNQPNGKKIRTSITQVDLMMAETIWSRSRAVNELQPTFIALDKFFSIIL